jgi:ABC-type sugar transport system permease subunit
VAAGVNVVIFYGLQQAGVTLRVPESMGSRSLVDMTLVPVIVSTAVPTALGVIFALLLRNARRGRTWFSWITVLLAAASLGSLVLLDSPTLHRAAQGLFHLVPAASLVALVSPSLRSE